MNDIIKARYFLQAKGSKLKDLTSFGLMLATANSRYRDIRMKLAGGIAGDHNAVDPIEVDALVEYALLRYLDRTNRLPINAPEVLKQSTPLEEKRKIALRWVNA